MENLNNSHIYIFGEIAVKVYAETGDMAEVKDAVERGDGEIHVFPPNGCLTALLHSFIGWGDFIEISPPEYLEYVKIDFTEEDLGIGREF